MFLWRNWENYPRIITKYSKCSKILYTKVSDKMAYPDCADPEQTAPDGAVWSGSTLFAIPLGILRDNCIKSKIYAKKDCNKVLEILGRLLYVAYQLLWCFRVSIFYFACVAISDTCRW